VQSLLDHGLKGNEMKFQPDKTKMKDVMGRPLTQSLFLEPNYNDYAIYTLDGEDKTYKGKVYPSLKRLYLNATDPTEYEFATTYLIDWPHWKRLCGNAIILRHIEEWREELDLKMRAEAVRTMQDLSEDNAQAAKWLAERGWDRKGAGRPKKEETVKERQIQDRLEEEFSADIVRLEDWK
jgi:hypothetical protein